MYDVDRTTTKSVDCKVLIPLTVGLYNNIFICDPINREELLMETLITVIITQEGGICGIKKSGGKPVSKDVMKKVIILAKRRINKILEILQ